MNNKRIYAALLLTMVASIVGAQENQLKPNGKNDKPRIITTTDLGADPDDEQSMVRLLVCANEFDIEGLIVSTGCWKKTQSDVRSTRPKQSRDLESSKGIHRHSFTY